MKVRELHIVYSFGDYIAHAIISAGTSFAFSYAGGGSDGSDMNKMQQKSQTAKTKAKAKAKQTGKTYKKPQATARYNKAVKNSIGPAFANSAVSSTANSTVSKLYKGAYDYYTR